MNLKKLRLHHKLTQEELAFQLNVSRQVTLIRSQQMRQFIREE